MLWYEVREWFIVFGRHLCFSIGTLCLHVLVVALQRCPLLLIIIFYANVNVFSLFIFLSFFLSFFPTLSNSPLDNLVLPFLLGVHLSPLRPRLSRSLSLSSCAAYILSICRSIVSRTKYTRNKLKLIDPSFSHYHTFPSSLSFTFSLALLLYFWYTMNLDKPTNQPKRCKFKHSPIYVE